MDRLKEERTFLHDLSNPLAVVQGLVEASVEEIRLNPEAAASQLRRLEKALAAMERVRALVKARREDLIREGLTKDASQSENAQSEND